MGETENHNHSHEDKNSAKFSNGVDVEEEHSDAEDNEDDLEEVEGNVLLFHQSCAAEHSKAL